MQDNAIETIEHEGLKVKIYQDMDAESPASWGDDNLFLVHYHRDFWQEKKEVLVEDDLRDIYQGNKTDAVKELRRKYHIFPVSAYIHSGVSLSLASGFDCDAQGWDTSHVGAFFVAKEEFKTKKQAEDCAEGMIETWNQYLSGDVYGYVVEDEKGEHLDSCWRFYGIEQAREEGLSMAKWHAGERLKKHLSKVKAMIQNHVPLERRAEEMAI